MKNEIKTVCIRCGKLRIFYRRWKDKAEGSNIVTSYEKMVCPDAECQKIVDAKFAEMREKRAISEANRVRNLQAKKSN